MLFYEKLLLKCERVAFCAYPVTLSQEEKNDSKRKDKEQTSVVEYLAQPFVSGTLFPYFDGEEGSGKDHDTHSDTHKYCGEETDKIGTHAQ